MKTKQAYFLEIDYILQSNSKLNRKVIDDIKKEWIISEKFWVIPWIFIKKWFFITDWNHRIEAVKELWLKYIPIIILEYAEYKKIAFSPNTELFNVCTPKFIIDYEKTKKGNNLIFKNQVW